MPDELQTWFASRLPKDWFEGALEITSDGEEILVVGTLPDVELAGGTSAAARAAAQDARIDRFREETRDDRVRIAREGERHFRRKVGWGARCGDQMKLFTTASVPVMTRLRMPEWPGASGWSGCTRRTGSRACGRRWSRSTRLGARDR